MTPIDAATHPNPYPYYASLREGPGLVFDRDLNLWVASRADIIEAVLAHPDCLVRPATEAVPRAIAGTAAGTVFGHLARMNDGAAHATARTVLERSLAAADLDRLTATTAAIAGELALAHQLPSASGLTGWLSCLPTHAVAALLGFGAGELAPITGLVRSFVPCLSPLADGVQLAAASEAADALLARIERLQAAPPPDSLAARVGAEASKAGWKDAAAIRANLLGLLSQTHEASSGLIGNAVVALLTRPGRRQDLAGDPQAVRSFIENVCRNDAPVQNTRRFVARAASIAGEDLPAGAAILLLLGSAGHCPHGEGKLPAFGAGRHACPGREVALTISCAATDFLIQQPELLATPLAWTYRRSVNGRVPVFTAAQGHP